MRFWARRLSSLAVLSLLVTAATAGVAIYAWRSAVQAERERLTASARDTARECAGALERRIWAQSVALRDLAYDWSHFGPKADDERRHDVQSLLEQYPSIRSVRWGETDAESVSRGDGAALREHDAVLREVETHAATAPSQSLVPVRFRDGAFGFVAVLSSRAVGPGEPSTRLEVVRAAISLDALMTGALEGRAAGYAVALRSGGDEVARNGETLASGADWWRATEEVTHPFGASFVLELRPSATLARGERSLLPGVVLATGLVAALLVGALVFTTRVAVRRARAIEASNAALAEIARRGGESAAPDPAGLEEIARVRAEELREAVTDLEAFNVSVSHDLRSPIGAIVNLVSVLRESQRDRLDAEALELLRRIEGSSLRALDRMDGLLDFSRLGKPLQREQIDMQRLAGRIAQELRRDTQVGRTEFDIQQVPAVHGDPAMVEALLRNLLDNGAKFSSGHEKPRVEFGALPPDQGQHQTVYFVRDNGVGFEQKFAEKLFGLFERQHSAEFEGTGVGLAIVSRVARRHGGRAWAEGEPGQGATFYFTLGGAA